MSSRRYGHEVVAGFIQPGADARKRPNQCFVIQHKEIYERKDVSQGNAGDAFAVSVQNFRLSPSRRNQHLATRWSDMGPTGAPAQTNLSAARQMLNRYSS